MKVVLPGGSGQVGTLIARARIGLPATAWMLAVGAVFLRTETELVLKSRRVVPGRLLDSGFSFRFPDWDVAAQDLCARWRVRYRG